ncbi:MAG TPA: sulfate ABC transporter substrate-binding protein [Kofleriaceae bacterium]|nr:sulfate ABC transporter substrate-binding protein [Kofleriaceae bacterium]
MALCAILGGGCAGGGGDRGGHTLTLGSYASARDLFHDGLIPGFVATWRTEHREALRFRESYQGSGHQSRAVIMGFEADVVALSIAPDADRIAAAGLMSANWDRPPAGGPLASTAVVLAVRAGNPAAIRGWADLARPGIAVVMPNPKVSGGARWTVAALYAAAMHGAVSGVPARDPAAAERYLAAVIANVATMSKSARDAMLLFERGIGDVIVTYENEVIASRRAGTGVVAIVPEVTLRVELPVAVVTAYADRHGELEAAHAFMRYLQTAEAGGIMARFGYRGAGDVPPPGMLTIADLGGWERVSPILFGSDGMFLRALAAAP